MTVKKNNDYELTHIGTLRYQCIKKGNGFPIRRKGRYESLISFEELPAYKKLQDNGRKWKYTKTYKPIMDRFILDVDSEDLNKALEVTRELIQFLVDYKDYINVYFSGSKGFHIEILTDGLDIVDTTADKSGESCYPYAEFLEYFHNKYNEVDTSLKDVGTRPMRKHHTKHEKTNNYKIIVDINASIEEILKNSKANQDMLEPAESILSTDKALELLEKYNKPLDKPQQKTPHNKPEKVTFDEIEFEVDTIVTPTDYSIFVDVYNDLLKAGYGRHDIGFFIGCGLNGYVSIEDVKKIYQYLKENTDIEESVNAKQSFIDAYENDQSPCNLGTLSNRYEDKNINRTNFDRLSAYLKSKYGNILIGEMELAPNIVQFHNNGNYKDGLYNKYYDKDKGDYNYIFKGNILLHELNTTYDILDEFKPVVSIKYTNTAINKTVSIEDKSFNEISQNINNAQLIDTNSQGIESILRKIAIHSVNKNVDGVKVTANEDLFKQGFFYDKNQDKIIHNNEFTNIEISKENVQSAISLVNALIKNRGNAIQNECTVFRLMLWAPYGYALKQLGFNKSLYGAVLWGVRDTNKTGCIENWSYLYANPDIVIQDADTTSAFGTRLGENSYPLTVDEAFVLLSNKDNNEPLKKAVTNKTARAVKDKYDADKINPSPALRIPLFTLNDFVPIFEKEEFIKRYKILHYDTSMRINKTDRKKFDKEYKPRTPDSPLTKLKYLGRVFGSKFETYLNEKSDKLHDLESLTVDILKEIAEEYDTPFENAVYEIQELEIDSEDIGAKISEGLRKLYFKIHKTYGYDGITAADFEFSAKYGEFNWLDYQQNNERYIIHVKEFEKEVNQILREYIPIDLIFEELDITLDMEENKNGFKTYTKFKGKTNYAVKIKEFDLIYKMFRIDIYEPNKVEEVLELEEKQKKREEERKQREREADRILNAKVIDR